MAAHPPPSPRKKDRKLHVVPLLLVLLFCFLHPILYHWSCSWRQHPIPPVLSAASIVHGGSCQHLVSSALIRNRICLPLSAIDSVPGRHCLQPVLSTVEIVRSWNCVQSVLSAAGVDRRWWQESCTTGLVRSWYCQWTVSSVSFFARPDVAQPLTKEEIKEEEEQQELVQGGEESS